MKACILFSARDAWETLKWGPCSLPNDRALALRSEAAERSHRHPPGRGECELGGPSSGLPTAPGRSGPLFLIIDLDRYGVWVGQ
jgi:hypothetical protein